MGSSAFISGRNLSRLMACLIVACALLSAPLIALAADPQDVTVQRVTTEEDGEAILVTCRLPLAVGARSVALTAYALDDEGGIITRRESYGGRRYAPDVFSRLGRPAAEAATASPVPVKVRKKGGHVYQFIFFDMADRFAGVVFAPPVKKNKPKPRTAPPVQPPKRPQPATKAERKLPAKAAPAPMPEQPRIRGAETKLPQPTGEEPSLASNTRLTFSRQPEIRSFLEAELARIREGRLKDGAPIETLRENADRVEPTPAVRPTTAYATEALRPYGIVPVWEYLTPGITPDQVEARLAQPFRGPDGPRALTAMDCAANICEYAIGRAEGDGCEYRVYFEGGRLKSLVLEMDDRVPARRAAVLNTLKAVYGGDIWRRGGRGPENGHLISQMEYHGDARDFLLETHGDFIRASGR